MRPTFDAAVIVNNMLSKNIGAAKNVSFKDAYLRYWLRWSDYRGRSSRQEYWKLVLDNAVISIVLSVIIAPIGASWIMVLFGLANLVPVTTLTIRRLHDAGHTGEWVIPLLAAYTVGLVLDIVPFISRQEWGILRPAFDVSVAAGTAGGGMIVVNGITRPDVLPWFLFSLFLVFFVFGIIVFVFLLQRSKPDNAWGLEPR
jgi:uncharacterized membrane protein YhaH (DUF805 family)